MEKSIESLNAIIKEIAAEKNRTAHLDVATALLNAAIERLSLDVGERRPKNKEQALKGTPAS